MAQLRRSKPAADVPVGLNPAQYKLRPAAHLSGKKVWSYGGSLLVQRVRSKINYAHSMEIERTLDSFRLGRSESACIINPATDADRYDRLKSIEFLVSTEELSVHVPPGRYRVWADAGGSVMYGSDYGLSKETAEIIVVADGEYLRAESHDDSIGLMWSSDVAALPALRAARRLLGEVVDGDDAIFVQYNIANGNGDTGNGSYDDVEEYLAIEEQAPISFFSAHFTNGCTFLWGAPAVRVEGSSRATSEIAVVYPRTLGRRAADGLIRETSTDQLRDAQATVESRIAQLNK